MKNVGKVFEEDFTKSIDDDIIYKLRLQDNPTSFKKYRDIKYVNKNPYDFLFVYKSHLFCFELKSTQESYITFARKEDEEKMIKFHQIKGLAKASKYKGIDAGFIINFRNDDNKTYYIPIKNFLLFMCANTKKSITEKEVIENGGVLVDGILKRTRYKYDVQKLFETLLK